MDTAGARRPRRGFVFGADPPHSYVFQRAAWVGVTNAQRGTFELFVMLALATIEIRRSRWALQWLCFGFWALSGVYVFLLGYDAEYIRDALPFI